jgi:hypothetical protein
VQDTIDSAHQLLASYRAASPDTRWIMLDGNHEARLRNTVLEQMGALYGLTTARGTDDTTPDQQPDPVLTTPYLLRLRDLDIDFVRTNGTYEHAQVKLTPNLAARHGWIARRGSGASALSTIEHLRFSVIIGHTHRQSIIYHTAHDIDGNPRTLLGCEAGTLAKIAGGMGYAIAPDWQQGFATADLHPDGTFKVDLATYTDGVLLYRDQQYRAA